MSIIDSIEKTFEGITIPVINTDFYIRMIGGSVKNIILIHETGEMYNTHLDVRVFAQTVNELMTMSGILKVRSMIVFEFLDKHMFRDMSIFKWDNCDYYYIQKEGLTEIKGGSYACEQTIDKLQDTIQGVLGRANG